MTTETKSDNTTETNNKSIFGPLGKYAVIAVIMVSIIVTTAIMLDKQLNTVEQQVAAIENEVANINATDADTIDTDATVVANDNELNTTTVATDSHTEEAQNTTAVAEVAITSDQAIPTDAQKASSEENSNTEQDIIAAVETTDTIETVATSQNTQDNQEQVAMSNNKQQFKDRITAYKVEQKQRMTDMFARIKALEAQQLDKYKASQEKQIARLRNQLSHQQEMIEALVIRNKDLFELRAANVQRIQTNREEMLNRI